VQPPRPRLPHALRDSVYLSRAAVHAALAERSYRVAQRLVADDVRVQSVGGGGQVGQATIAQVHEVPRPEDACLALLGHDVQTVPVVHRGRVGLAIIVLAQLGGHDRNSLANTMPQRNIPTPKAARRPFVSMRIGITASARSARHPA
jgi:hypothetical protein